MEGSEVHVVEIEGIEEFGDDDGVDRISSGRGVIFLPEGGHEISEYGTVLFGVRTRESGIRFTQVGDPLADGSEHLRYGISSDIVLTATGALSEAVGIDDDAVEAVMDIRDSLKRRVSSVVLAEGGPLRELLALGSACPLDIGLSGGFERRAEVSREASSGCRLRSRQGLGCGYRWSK